MYKTVLIVDDDPLLQRLLEGVLRSEGYRVQCAGDIAQALRCVQRHPPDAAIVDVDLGDSGSGLSLLGIWRTRHHFPVMVLSARGQPSDRVIGLELGALDYLAKPFDPRELLLRLRLILRRGPALRHAAQPPASWSLGDVVFDPAQRGLLRGTEKTPLSPLESELLAFMLSRANAPLTREQILNAVQHRDRHVNDRAVDVLVGRLRKKLGRQPVSIQAVRGIGYMLCGPVSQL